MCNRRSKKCQFIKIISIIFTVVLIVKISYELKYLDVLSGIFKIESDKNKKVHRFSLKTLSFITMRDDENYLIDEMEMLGWEYLKQYGRGMIFTKDGYEILITKRTYFNRYNFYEVNTREVFDLI